MLIVVTIAIIAMLIYYAIKKAKTTKISNAPMYPQYINLGDGHHYWTHEQRNGYKSFVCPWCRKSMYQASLITNYWGPFCKECDEKITKLAFSIQRPSYITEQDWQRISKNDKFWVIYRDHELGCIDDAQAKELMHCLTLKNGGEIAPVKYRDWQAYVSWSPSHLDSSQNFACRVCRGLNKCTCHELYIDDINIKKWPKLLNQYLDELCALNPTVVLDYYYRWDDEDDNVVHAKIKPRKGFVMEDYYTEDDWRTIHWLTNQAADGNCEEQTARDAVQHYLEIIVRDYKLLIKYHEAIKRGGQACFPFLPSTNPAKIMIKKRSAGAENDVGERLLNQFLQ